MAPGLHCGHSMETFNTWAESPFPSCSLCSPLPLATIHTLWASTSADWKLPYQKVDVENENIFDPYSGPLRGNCRYWVGSALVARGILLLVFSLNSTNDPSVNLLTVNTMLLLLLVYTASVPHKSVQVDISHNDAISKQLTFWLGSCYKKWFLSFLENSTYTVLSSKYISILRT